MLGSSRVAAQQAASEGGLSSMQLVIYTIRHKINTLAQVDAHSGITLETFSVHTKHYSEEP
jgi:hypothetical protein